MPTEYPEKFADFEGLNIEETLALAEDLDEDDLQEFIAFEEANLNRKGVLEVLVVDDEDDEDEEDEDGEEDPDLPTEMASPTDLQTR